MSERKVLNKYYPPDFDPSKIPRRSQPKNAQQVVRLMAPFSMRCNSCGDYVYKGKKFNARKETVEGEDYYGIKIFRFYIKCTLCSAEITFKTDPKNTDYVAEHGAQRNFEPWREESAIEEEDRLAKLEEEENNPMKVLENRTTDSKREMDILDALQDIRARNARYERVDDDAVRSALDGRIEILDEEELERLKEEEEDEKLVRQVFSKVEDPSAVASSSGASTTKSRAEGEDDDDVPTPETPAPATITIKRKADYLEPDFTALVSDLTKTAKPKAAPVAKKKKSDMANLLGIKRPQKGKAKA